MSTINKTTLQSYYQNIGDVYSDVNTEACFELIADAQNDSYAYALGLVNSDKLTAVGIINVRDLGAKGDWNGVTGNDDTAAIQAAFDVAALSGGRVYIPDGNYHTTAPLTIKWTATPDSGKPAYPKIGAIIGQSANAVIYGTIATAGRAVLELLGENNGYAVNMYIENFTLRMTGGNSGAYCLRVGDAKNGFQARKINCFGANGLLVKVASSTSYAQIGTAFRDCTFSSNSDHAWFSNDNLATVFSMQIASGGAYCDNLYFENCSFIGMAVIKAHICNFVSCQFSTNPLRLVSSGGYGSYANNVLIAIGNANFTSCYFEDYSTSLNILDGSGDIGNISVRDCHFSGITNYGVNSDIAVLVAENLVNSYKIGVVTIDNCEFGTHNNEPIYITSTNARVYVGKITNINNRNGGVSIRGHFIPTSIETIWFQGAITSASSTFNLEIFNNTPSKFHYWKVDNYCSISKIKFLVLDNSIVSGTIQLNIYKNGAIIFSGASATYPTAFTNTYVEAALGEEGTIYNPFLTSIFFAPGDRIQMTVISAALNPVTVNVCAILELCV